MKAQTAEALGAGCHYVLNVRRAWNYPKAHLYLNEDNMTEKDWTWLFKRKLKNMMAYTRVTQLELSQRVGVTQVMIYKYTRGTATPSSYKLYLIAESLGCSVRDLFYEFIEMEDTEWER